MTEIDRSAVRDPAWPARVDIYDTTLRDGSQLEGISLTVDDKLRIAEQLDRLGVGYIEGGWPGANPKDDEFFERARTELKLSTSEFVAFGSTRRPKGKVDSDPTLANLVAAGTGVVCIVGKCWDYHVTEALKTTLDEGIAMVRDSVEYLVAQGKRVFFDAEHFFDGYKADAGYALATLQAAQRGGASTLVLCDTNGGSMPWEVDEIVRAVRAELGPDVELGAHVHDDGGCGVANTLAAVRAGVRHVQGTINGYGERCGNANLCAIIPDIELKLGLSCLPAGGLPELYDLAHFVAEVANVPANEHAAYVGRSAVAHKGGVHVAAIRRHPASYQHIEPELVGNECRVVVSELSGRANVLSKAEELGVSVSSSEGAAVLQQIKRAEAQGFAYEAAEASVALLMARCEASYEAPFEVLEFQTALGKRAGAEMFSEATVKLSVHGDVVHTAGEGNGPVSALDQAIRKAIRHTYAAVADVHLSDYKVRILDGKNGTSATVRVLIDSRSHDESWSTVGASTNIIEASLLALVDSLEYAIRLETGRALDDEG